jgi:DNA invertase Pin-like site-specific DNA recombinase
MTAEFVSYIRKSPSNHLTTEQGLDSNSIGAQRTAIERYLNGGNWALVKEFVEYESGRKSKRPQLMQALALCKTEGATLVISRLDRLARNAAFLMTLLESDVKFVALDCPNADRFYIRMMAVFAQKEAEDISARTKAGMAVAKARGAKIGNPNPAAAIKRSVEVRKAQSTRFAESMLPIIEDIKKGFADASLRDIALALNRRGYATATGKPFHHQTVKNILERINNIQP